MFYQGLTNWFDPPPYDTSVYAGHQMHVWKKNCVSELTDTRIPVQCIHLFLCVGVQSNTLARLWFLEGNKNPTQLNLT